MAEEKKLCRDCKWFYRSSFGDPRTGECKKPRGESETLSTEGFKMGRHGGKWIPDVNQEAGDCPYFERAKGFEDYIQI
jgi:hypothetical protein